MSRIGEEAIQCAARLLEWLPEHEVMTLLLSRWGDPLDVFLAVKAGSVLVSDRINEECNDTH